MKILFVVPSFRNGGTISSLKNLLTQLDLSKYTIDVYAITNIGPNREFISKYVNVLGVGLDDGKIKQNLKTSLKKYLFKFVKTTKKALDKIKVDISPILFKSVVSKLERSNYDIVIAFQEGQATRFVSYFKKPKKISWIHCDYSSMVQIAKIKPQHKLYSKINKIVCVSEYTKNIFIQLLPETKEKTIALHNLISSHQIIEKSEDLSEIDSKFEFSGFKIVSVGRLDPVKRFSYIPEITSSLKQKGYSFRWYIIGGGDNKEKQLIIDNIKSHGVENELILLGEKNNPYPYIKNADLLVSTSLSEACPYVINEAKILGTPIVATDFGSVYEFIDDNINGLISPVEAISDKIERLISDQEAYKKIKENILLFKYDNSHILNVLQNKILI